ncbi:hypothetical protein M2283_009401 [Streptomyces pseudovenezuelae]|uniref:Transposase n=1 Tax=Streptomyces pseudovenezuelae TaxID=67350 RepID=A0ABT6M0G6_9ACTN|nr:hypothetical protein [Streptomyces pseudovenezuelae]
MRRPSVFSTFQRRQLRKHFAEHTVTLGIDVKIVQRPLILQP